MSYSNLFAGLIFGGIGFVAFRFGRQMERMPPILIGIFLMAYPYFVSNDFLLWGLGIAGTAALWFFRE